MVEENAKANLQIQRVYFCRFAPSMEDGQNGRNGLCAVSSVGTAALRRETDTAPTQNLSTAEEIAKEKEPTLNPVQDLRVVSTADGRNGRLGPDAV